MLERRVQIAADVRDDAEVLLDAADQRRYVPCHRERLPKEIAGVGCLSRLELEAAECVERFRRECGVANLTRNFEALLAQLVGNAALELAVHDDAESAERLCLRGEIAVGKRGVDRRLVFVDGDRDAPRALVVTSVAEGAGRRRGHGRGRHDLG